MIITDYLSADLFKGKSVFITGGGSGINLGIAKNFAAVGASIGICGRTQSKLDDAAEELRGLGADVFTAACDVRDYDALKAAIDGAADRFNALDVLVCGAAGNFPCPAEGLSPNGFKSVMDIDTLGSFHAARASIEHLKASKGNVLFISAPQAYQAYNLQCHVGAAKAAVDNLMKNLALEWGPYGIRSNSIAPGPIAGTEGVKRLTPPGMGEKVDAIIPMRRHGTVDDIGQLAVFLASPLAAYITGTVVICDGGMSLPGSGQFTSLLLSGMEG